MIHCMNFTSRPLLILLFAFALIASACSGSSSEPEGSVNSGSSESSDVERTADAPSDEQEVAASVTCIRAAEGSEVFDLTVPNDTDTAFEGTISVSMFDADGVLVHSLAPDVTAIAGTTVSLPITPPQDAGPIATCEATLASTRS